MDRNFEGKVEADSCCDSLTQFKVSNYQAPLISNREFSSLP
jgi:hypothetical protein